MAEVVVSARAPGKVIICGEHAVVHGASAVAAAVGLYTQAQIRYSRTAGNSTADDGVLRLELVQLELCLEWPLALLRSALKMPEADPTLVRSCTQELMAALRGLVEKNELAQGTPGGVPSGVMAFLFLYSSIVGLQPAVVTIDSEIPIGAGLGSSAAFSVALSALFLASTQQLHKGGDVVQGEGWTGVSEADSDLINKWGFEAEKIIHGKPSGIDNTVSTFGRVVKFKKGHLTRLDTIQSLRILITNTRVGRDTKLLVAGVGILTEKHPKTMSTVFEAVDSISEEVIEILQSMSEANKSSYTNNEINGLSCSKTEEETKLEDLVAINQGLLQSMGVSHPSIEMICAITSRYTLKSKLTGAGGGGCVMTLLPSSVSSELLEEVIRDLSDSGFECLKADIGCTGVQILYS